MYLRKANCRYVEAERDATRAIQYDEKNVKAYYRRGMSYREHRRFREAKEGKKSIRAYKRIRKLTVLAALDVEEGLKLDTKNAALLAELEKIDQRGIYQVCR